MAPTSLAEQLGTPIADALSVIQETLNSRQTFDPATSTRHFTSPFGRRRIHFLPACGSAHHWGRWFAAHGHTARLIPAEFVVPFRKGGKNDTADAEAVAIASRQPTMRFVPIKTVDQQAILAWHSVREGWKEERTALLNRVRGLLAE